MSSDFVELTKEAIKLAVRAKHSFTIWVVLALILCTPLPDFLRLDAFSRAYASKSARIIGWKLIGSRGQA